jgi:hypothetical protein
MSDEPTAAEEKPLPVFFSVAGIVACIIFLVTVEVFVGMGIEFVAGVHSDGPEIALKPGYGVDNINGRHIDNHTDHVIYVTPASDGVSFFVRDPGPAANIGSS